MNKKYIRIIAFLAVALIVVFLLFPELLPFDLSQKESKKPAEQTSQVSKGVVIDALIVNTESFDNDIVLAGSLLANEAVELASEISGKIDRIYFDEGQYVKKGQLLLTTNVDNLKADYKQLKYTSELNANTEKRQKQLLESEAISKEEYDIAFTNLKTVEAEMESVKAQIEKSRISAPFSGYVGLRYISEGSYLTPSTEIASLYNVDPIKIEFSIPSRYSQFIKKGSTITFSSEAEDIDRKAQIYAIEPQIDPVTRTLKVRAKCENPDNALIPGQFVRVKLSLESKSDAILIPTTAIMPKANGHMVFIIEGGQAMAKDVELGIRTSKNVEIISGIAAGDTVAIAGVPQLKDRAAVSIKKLEKEGK